MQHLSSNLSITPFFLAAMPCWTTWHLTGRTPSLSLNAHCVGKCGVEGIYFECIGEGGDVRWKGWTPRCVVVLVWRCGCLVPPNSYLYIPYIGMAFSRSKIWDFHACLLRKVYLGRSVEPARAGWTEPEIRVNLRSASLVGYRLYRSTRRLLDTGGVEHEGNGCCELFKLFF